MRKFVLSTLLLASVFDSAFAQVLLQQTFGSGANAFTMDFVTIGNAGNTADSNDRGAVGYNYQMGKYEVSFDMYSKASSAGGLNLPVFSWGLWADRPTQPVYSGTFYNYARFVNWLNTSSGYAPAYKFSTQPTQVGYNAYEGFNAWNASDTGYSSSNPFRNTQAKYFIPTLDEWYKSAYYNPSTGTYFDFATGSNTVPTPVTSGTTAGTAVYGQDWRTPTADITNAGGLSPYGTMAQTGNLWEWTETDPRQVLSGVLYGDKSVVVGGEWDTPGWKVNPETKTADYLYGDNRTSDGIGLRVASTAVPEPSSFSLLALGGLALVLNKRRRA